MEQENPHLPPKNLSPGEIIANGYEICRDLGGTPESLYRVFEVTTQDGARALKLLQPVRASNEQLRQRFHREHKILEHLKDVPRVVRVYERGCWTRNGWEYHYFLMEPLGRSLRRHLQDQGGKLDWREAVQLCRQLAEGLSDCHQRLVVHRDLKPENCLFSVHDELKLIDFGISQCSSVSGTQGDLLGTTWYQTQYREELFGTQGYRAPEMADREREITDRFDLFALGIMLYELCLGERPFSVAHDAKELEKVISQGPRQRLGEQLRQAPDALDKLVQRMLAFSPGDRPSAREVVAALQNLCDLRQGDHGGPYSRPWMVGNELAAPVDDRKLAPPVVQSPAWALPSVPLHAPLRAEVTQLTRLPQGPAHNLRRRGPRWLGLAVGAAALSVLVAVLLTRDPSQHERGGGGKLPIPALRPQLDSSAGPRGPEDTNHPVDLGSPPPVKSTRVTPADPKGTEAVPKQRPSSAMPTDAPRRKPPVIFRPRRIESLPDPPSEPE